MTTWLDRSPARDHGICDRLLNRQLGDHSNHSRIKGLYADRQWVRNLDIVNELSGHSGCVNALSWSKSGRLLASGSDDQHLNIHSYQPDGSTSDFKLTTSVSTGHSQNIFSVKFMPHSNDRTLVTCAGDRQVRIFDLEYAGRAPFAGDMDGLSSQRAREHICGDVRHLGQGDTNAKVFRSHGDRVKRIVTESSPYFFLTCSEDGEVRQWDLRQPSSAYPAPRRGRVYRQNVDDDDASDIPPPLISYRRFQLDLNTISCSPSQPHYIALGGAHLHCFLHDRRMLGRDKLLERGSSVLPSSFSEHDNTLMGEATRCVRKFAPDGKTTMDGSDSGHITACKISDANPNEMIASWSGDWIYSFDLLRSPDAYETRNGSQLQQAHRKSNRLKSSRDRKRKRDKTGSTTSQDIITRGSSKARRTHSPAENSSGVAIRVHYDNGQIENIPVGPPSANEGPQVERELSEAERKSYRVASATVQIRKHIFSSNGTTTNSDNNSSGSTASFTSALGFVASLLPEMDEISRSWRYPINPTEVDVASQDIFRRQRESARRFIQACGTVARLLGGRLHSAKRPTSIEYFASIQPTPNEKSIVDVAEQFHYDFLKAITAWLDSGPGAVLEAFTNHSVPHRANPRRPIPPESPIESIDEVLVPHFLHLAGPEPIVDVMSSRFESDSRRMVFESELAAVTAFAAAIKIPFEDLSDVATHTSSSANVTKTTNATRSQDRKTAVRFWGLKVCRGILLNACKGLDALTIDRAFGGFGQAPLDTVLKEERRLQQQLEEIDTNVEEPEVAGVGVTSQRIAKQRAESALANEDISANSNDSEEIQSTDDDEEDDEFIISVDDIAAAIIEQAENGTAQNEPSPDELETDRDDHEDDDNDDNDNELGDGEEEDDGSEGSATDEAEAAEDGDGASARHFLYQSILSRSSLRARVQPGVDCSEHTRSYRGHCNVKTVKDVNFYGLNDEYVVSGSDSGHLFIWDKRTSQLVNILEGDGEVVNVVQGHPYEPMLAVSGIDHTIKIFNSDARARHHAKSGVGVSAADDSGWSSIHRNRLRFGGTRPLRAHNMAPGNPESTSPQYRFQRSSNRTPESDVEESESDPDAEEDPSTVAHNGLHSKRRMKREYEITSQNDVERRGGNREAFLTHSMLAQLAIQLQQQRAAAAQGRGGEQGETGFDPEDALAGDGPTVLSDDCTLM